MGENSKIEWCDHTMNFWIGCTEVSPACDHCYARTLSHRYGWAEWGDHPRHRTSWANWRKLLGWNREAQRLGRRLKVFANSLSDFLDNQVQQEWRDEAGAMILACDHLDLLILTKRPQLAVKLAPASWRSTWPENVWLGTTVENRPERRRIDMLRDTPASVRFISMEPLLEHPESLNLRGIHWVICGGESGPNKRKMDLQWPRFVRNRCAEAGVPFFMKQIDKVQPIPDDLMVRQFPATPTSPTDGANG